ncbi:hypothetical protein JOD44_000468 [Salimicrobium jeotgali]|nr:hypothetical protein [Salimicrobium jeotgali]
MHKRSPLGTIESVMHDLELSTEGGLHYGFYTKSALSANE